MTVPKQSKHQERFEVTKGVNRRTDKIMVR